MPSNWLVAGSITGFLTVAGGAFGAHALKEHLSPERIAVFEIGVRYAMLHTAALLVTGLLARERPGRALQVAGSAFLLGIVLFTGSLWALAISGITKLGAITPLGGLCFLTGWVALGRAAATTTATRPDATGTGRSSG